MAGRNYGTVAPVSLSLSLSPRREILPTPDAQEYRDGRYVFRVPSKRGPCGLMLNKAKPSADRRRRNNVNNVNNASVMPYKRAFRRCETDTSQESARGVGVGPVLSIKSANFPL